MRQLCYLRRSNASNLSENSVCAYMNFLYSTLSYNLPMVEGGTQKPLTFFVQSGLPRHEYCVFFGNNIEKVHTDFRKSYHLIHQKRRREEKVILL